MENPFEKLYLSVKFNNIYRRSVKGPVQQLVAKELAKPKHHFKHLPHDEPEETFPDVNPPKVQRHILSRLSNDREVTPEGKTTRDEEAIPVSSDSSLSEDDDDVDNNEAEIHSSPVIHSHGKSISENHSEKTPNQCSKIDVKKKRLKKLSRDVTDDQKLQKADTKANATKKRSRSSRKPTAGACCSMVTKTTTSNVLKSTNVKGRQKRTTTSKVKSNKDKENKKRRIVNREGESENDTEINFVKGDFGGGTRVKSSCSYHLAHLNIMPLSEALERVNAPLTVKPQSLFGLEGIINNRNIKWRTIVDEG